MLTKEQKIIVDSTLERIAVNAAPGSGKTRVLSERAKLLQDTILCITFTNQAAKVLASRIGNKAHCSTFHKLAYNILRQYHGTFSIIDQDDSLSIIRKIIKNEKDYKAADIYEKIQGWKDNQEEPTNDKEKWILREYCSKLSNINGMDFQDLLLNSLNYIQEYGSQFKHILIDEFHDCSKLQLKMSELLMEQASTTFVVADFDQVIYEWRGARPQNVNSFISDNEFKVYPMGENFRCPKLVVDFSASLISKNKSRLDKQIFSNRGKEDSIVVKRFHNDREEFKWIADLCKMLTGSTAILCRTGNLCSQLEGYLREKRLPYKVLDGFKLLDRAVCRDIVSILKLYKNNDDTISLHRILKSLKSGFGDKTLERAPTYLSLMELDLSDRQLIGFNQLSKCIDIVSSEKDTKKIIEKLRDEIYKNYEKEEKELIELLAISGSNKTVDQFLEEIVLNSGVDTNQSKLSIMTMHSAKGTEFDNVILLACNEGTCPHTYNDNIEEERRLFYVAMTRAKEKLYLTYSDERYIFSHAYTRPSRFLYESGLIKNDRGV